jgi:ankyrin repeat protein
MARNTTENRAIAQWDRAKLSASEVNEQLFAAARKGWVKAVQELLALGGDANAVAWGRSVLAIACGFGVDDVATAKVLLSAGADPNGSGVMETCGVATMPILIDAGGRLNGEKSGVSPLLSAIVIRTKEDKALALIEAGANVDVCDAEGSTPLMLAAERGRLKIFDALIQAGADLFAVDAAGRSVLRRVAETAIGGRLGAIGTHRKYAMQILRKLRDHLPAQPEDTVLIDIVLGDVKELNRKLASGLDPNVAIVGGVGDLGLLWADYVEHLKNQGDIDKILVIGVLPSRRNLDCGTGRSTLLMWAVVARNLPIIKLLLQAGADPDLKNDAGVSARILAREWCDSTTRSLIDNWPSDGFKK